MDFLLAAPCPDIDDLNVMTNRDHFLCAVIWLGFGHNEPSLGCNPPLCSESSDYSEGGLVQGDTYIPAGSNRRVATRRTLRPQKLLGRTVVNGAIEAIMGQ